MILKGQGCDPITTQGPMSRKQMEMLFSDSRELLDRQLGFLFYSFSCSSMTLGLLFIHLYQTHKKYSGMKTFFLQI